MVHKQKYRNYVHKSDEFYRGAREAAERADWDLVVSNAVHSSICIVDALTVFHLGRRSAAQSHEESLRLLAELKIDQRELERNIEHLSALLALKSVAEYGDQLLESKDATGALQHLNRFRRWALARMTSAP